MPVTGRNILHPKPQVLRSYVSRLRMILSGCGAGRGTREVQISNEDHF